MYVKQLGEKNNWKPEDCSKYENFDENLPETLKIIGNILNRDGKKHIVLLDEVDLTGKFEESIGDLELDLSYLSDYTNIHFIICLRPAYPGLNNFKISCVTHPNQSHCNLKNVYRNAEAIQKLMQKLLLTKKTINEHSEGHVAMNEIDISENLPPPLIPPGCKSCIIWIPKVKIMKDEAVLKVHKLVGVSKKSSVAILYSKGQAKDLAEKKLVAKKLKGENENWSGPYEDLDYNGGEADVVIFVTDDGEDLNIQTLARARRLLIILTWSSQNANSLKKAASENLLEMVKLRSQQPKVKSHNGKRSPIKKIGSTSAAAIAVVMVTLIVWFSQNGKDY